MPYKILVVDDEEEVADLIELYLSNDNFQVLKFYSPAQALAEIPSLQPDLAVLDIMMPEMDGLTLCRRIRENCTFPIIMLTAKGDETDKITALTLGADDYITKPFRPLELLARVKAQLRRYKRYNSSSAAEELPAEVIEHSGILLNTRTHQCFLGDNQVILTPTEFTLLQILLENAGRVMSA